MAKSIDERLFEQLMRTPRVMRRGIMEQHNERDFGEDRGPRCEAAGGPGCEGHGPRPDFEEGRGPRHGDRDFGHHGGGHCEGGPGPECHRHGDRDFGHHGDRRCEGGPEPECPRHGEGHGSMHEMHHGPERPEHGRGPKPGFARERVLGIIAEHENGVRQKTLCEELRINPSSVSELIGKLENDGYVRRTVDPDDRRATLIVLTELGQARAAELEDEQRERFSGLFGNLTEDEKEQLLTLLQKIAD